MTVIYAVFQRNEEDALSYHKTFHGAEKAIDDEFKRNKQEHIEFDARLYTIGEFWIEEIKLLD